jgi:hypothetical protein
MIYQSLHCLAEEINDFFKAKLQITEDKVLLSSIVNQDGTVAIPGENKIVLTLVTIEKETAQTSAGYPSSSRTSNGQISALNINLQIMLSAYFSGSNYPEGLKFLSFIIAFLQRKPVFNQSNTPRLPNEIEKLSFDLDIVGSDKLSHIWTMLGAKYMPSVIYKLRMLTFDDATVLEYRPVVRALHSNDQTISL